MSKKHKSGLMIMICVIAIAAYMIGCSHGNTNTHRVVAAGGLYGDSNSPFVVVDRGEKWTIVYHSSTKVMYVVGGSGYSDNVTFTELVNADGTPLLYEQDE